MYEIASADRQNFNDDMKALSTFLLSFNQALSTPRSTSQVSSNRAKNPAIRRPHSLQADSPVARFSGHGAYARHADASMLFGGGSKSDDTRTLAEFTAKDIKGNLVSLKDFVGKVVLIVNVASA